MGLSDQEKRLVRAIGQAMFPRDRSVDVDADDVHLVSWVDDYLGRMPAANRTQVRALFHTFDLGFGAWALRPGTRFTAGKATEQYDYIESWSNSNTFAQRMLFEALWCVVAFGYVEQAEKLGHIGQGAKPEPLQLPAPPEAAAIEAPAAEAVEAAQESM